MPIRGIIFFVILMGGMAALTLYLMATLDLPDQAEPAKKPFLAEAKAELAAICGNYGLDINGQPLPSGIRVPPVVKLPQRRALCRENEEIVSDWLVLYQKVQKYTWQQTQREYANR